MLEFLPPLAILEDSLLYPDADPAARAALLDRIFRHRETLFIAGILRMERGDFDDLLSIYRSLPNVARQRFLAHPTARVIFRQLPTHGDRADRFVRRLRALMLGGEEACSYSLFTEPLGIPITRLEIDLELAEALPPSYDVRDPAHHSFPEARYTLEIAKEVLDRVLRTIQLTWSEAAQEIGRHVALLMHVLDADFRSCSASRYAGLVILTANDDTLLALEESLMHEFGHQLLYAMMELDPLIKAQGSDEFTLPWSGRRRDFYGFLHATYIYELLRRYYARRSPLLEGEAQWITDRRQEIASGLREAAPILEHNMDRFTPLGSHFVRRLLEESTV